MVARSFRSAWAPAYGSAFCDGASVLDRVRFSSSLTLHIGQGVQIPGEALMAHFLAQSIRLAVIGAASAALVSLVSAGTAAIEEARLTTPDGRFGSDFGDSLSLSGNTLAVGAPHSSPPGFVNAGAVYVLVRTGVTWTSQAKLVAPDMASGDVFGISVALANDTLAIGARGDDNAAGTSAGAVYVFVRSGSSWALQAKLIAADAHSQDNFGQSVALRNDTLLVGAPYADMPPVGALGSAYLFGRTGSLWTQQFKFIPSDAATTPPVRFGHSVSLSGNRVVVGAPGDTFGGTATNAGSAYVFSGSAFSWAEEAKLVGSTISVRDEFGTSVALDFETALVGTEGDGASYVFWRSGNTWIEQARLDHGSMPGGIQFGSSVALQGDTAVVGWPLAGPPPCAKACGAVFTFERSGTTWTNVDAFQSSDVANSSRFGRVVSLSGDTLAVSAEQTNVVYVYRLSEPYSSFCFGDGSLLASCPCAPPNTVPNPSGSPGHGCANSFNASGALLSAYGTVMPDTLVLRADVGPNYVGFAFGVKGQATAPAGIPNGDGIRCVSGTLLRFGGHGAGTGGAPTGVWTYPNTNQTTAISTATAQPSLETAYYQIIYRNAVANFCSSATTNWSNVIEAHWP